MLNIYVILYIKYLVEPGIGLNKSIISQKIVETFDIS